MCAFSPAVEQMLNMYNTTKAQEIAPEVLSMYPDDAFVNGWTRMSAIITDFMFACSARRAVRYGLRGGHCMLVSLVLELGAQPLPCGRALVQRDFGAQRPCVAVPLRVQNGLHRVRIAGK